MADYLESLIKRGLISDDYDIADRLRMMTHQAEQPNPVRPIVDAARGYLQSGDYNPLHEPGTQPADYLRELFRNPDILAKNVQQASNFNFGGMANPTPRIVGSVKAMVDEMIARGASKNAIAEAAGTGTATIGRYLAKSGQKTAASENPYRGVLGDLGNDEVIKAGLVRRDSYATIAQRIGTSEGNVNSRVGRLRAAGELSDIQLRPSNESKALLADPEKRADLIRLAKEGTSHGDIASYFFGGPGGKHPRRGEISRFIRQLQEEGEPELQNYTPQSGTGLTPAGRTPTVVQTKTQARPLPSAEDLKYGQDFARALSAFTQSR